MVFSVSPQTNLTTSFGLASRFTAHGGGPERELESPLCLLGQLPDTQDLSLKPVLISRRSLGYSRCGPRGARSANRHWAVFLEYNFSSSFILVCGTRLFSFSRLDGSLKAARPCEPSTFVTWVLGASADRNYHEIDAVHALKRRTLGFVKTWGVSSGKIVLLC